MKKHLLIAASIAIVYLCVSGSASAAMTTSDQLRKLSTNDCIKSIYGDNFNPPFGKSGAVNEDISTSTGNLTLIQTDMVLKGKGGHDLILKREYTSQLVSDRFYLFDAADTTVEDRPAYVYRDQNNVSYYILFNSETQMMEEAFDTIANVTLGKSITNYDGKFYHYTGLVPGNLILTRDKSIGPKYTAVTFRTRTWGAGAHKFYDIGNNWRLMLPYLDEQLAPPPEYAEAADTEGAGEFYNGEGAVYTYEQFAKYNRADVSYTPEYLHITDGSVSEGNSIPLYTAEYVSFYDKVEGGIAYNRIVTDKYGKKMYFNQRGAIAAIDDRYGNRIRFEYDTQGNLVKIVDSMGRIITVGSTNGLISSISVGDRTVTYNRISDSLLEITDAEGNTTAYETQKKEPLYGFAGESNLYTDVSGTRSYSSLFARKSVSYNVTRITYPTGAYTDYTYEKATPYFGRTLVAGANGNITDYGYGRRTKYKITSRQDNCDGKVYNRYEYSYNHPREGMDEVYMCIAEPQYTYTGTVLRESDGYVEEHIYNIHGQKEKVTGTGTDGCLTETVFTYANTRTSCAPATVREILYNSRNNNLKIELLKTYQYDSRQNIIRETIGDEYAADYTYDPAYNLLLTKTYKRDANNTVLVENITTADGKGIEWAYVKENGTKKQQTKYSYDTFGNITEKREYVSSSSSIITEYTYTYNADRTYKVYTYVESVTDADGFNSQTIGQESNYDIYGDLSSVKDGNGNTTTYTRDKLGRVQYEYYPDGTNKYNEYNTRQNYIIARDENGSRKKYQYDGLGNIKAVYAINPANQVLVQLAGYTYDPVGRKKTETVYRNYDDAGQVTEKFTTTYDYYSSGRVKTQTVTDISGNIIGKTDYTYEEAVQDTINGITGMYSKTTVQQTGDATITPAPAIQYHDKTGRLVKEETIHNGTTYKTTYKYDYVGNKLETKGARAYAENWAEPNTTKYEYDHANRVVKETNALGKYIQTVYDWLGRATSKTDYYGRNTNYTYDKLGRLVKVVSPFEGTYHATTKIYYDKNGNKTREVVNCNVPGQTSKYTTTEYGYDSRNRLIKVKKNTPTGYTQYTYDGAGNKTAMYTGLKSEINTGTETGSDTDYAVTRYEYNYLNQLKKVTDPMGLTRWYTYDLAGNIIRELDREGIRTTYTYDGYNRLLTKSVTKDGTTKTETNTYDMVGNRKTMTDETGTTTYTYDGLSRLKTETAPGGITKEYGYDPENNRTTFTLKQNGIIKQNISYTYDKLNRLENVKENGQTITTYGYDDNGNRTGTTYKNGNTTDYTYNEGNKLKTITNKKSGAVVSQYSYTYYLDGNQETKTDNTGVTTYTYDGHGRLKTITEPGAATTTYTYDDYGNRSKAEVTGGTNPSTTTYTYDKNNRLIKEVKTAGDTEETTHYAYDKNGNQVYRAKETTAAGTAPVEAGISGVGETENPISKDITICAYDGYNRLTTVKTGGTTAQYTYNGDGLRIAKTINGTTTTHIWDGAEIVYEITGAAATKYIRGISLIAKDDGTRRYYLFNGHGDVIQLTGTDGSVTQNYDYDAWGNEKNPDVADANPFRYCGEYFDKETGTIYLRARYYDPATSRMLTEDSYWGDIRDPLSLNLYTYCKNDPVNRIDPSGHDSYVYYDPSDHGFTKQAEAEAKRLEKQYGTPVHLVGITTTEQFKKNWNGMGSYKDKDGNTVTVSIEGVSLLFHGSPHTLNIDYTKDQYLTTSSDGKTPGGRPALYIGDLDSKTFDKLTILSCNGGHIDHLDDNVAVTFLNSNNVKKVIAWDGSVSYSKTWVLWGSYYPRLAYDQSAYYSWTPDSKFLWFTFKRAPLGEITYTKDENGNINWDFKVQY